MVVELADTSVTVSTVFGSGLDMSLAYFAVEFVLFGLDYEATINSANYPFSLRSLSSFTSGSVGSVRVAMTVAVRIPTASAAKIRESTTSEGVSSD